MIPSFLPTIDLHGYDRESARIAIQDFIRDRLLLKEYSFVIIHGIGKGILQREVATVLKKDKRVQSFALSFMNPGCTIVKLVETIDKTKRS